METTLPPDEPAPQPVPEHSVEASGLVEQPASSEGLEPQPATSDGDSGVSNQAGDQDLPHGMEPPLAPVAADETDGEPIDPEAQLTALAAKSQIRRLSAADEERAVQAIKAILLHGRAGVAVAVEMLPKFAWMVAVNGVTAAWPELTSGFRTQLFAGLAKNDSDASRRIRLSLARGIYKHDVPSALKIAVGVAKDLRDKDTGLLSPRNAQIFASVFIGRAKPWLAGLPLGELKATDADALVHCALLSAFLLPHPPVTQLGVLKWAAESGRLVKLHEAALDAVTKGVNRWSGKWQSSLRKEVPTLPEEIAAVLKPAEGPAQGNEDLSAQRIEPLGAESVKDEEESGEAILAQPVVAEANAAEEEASEAPLRARSHERPVYVSRTVSSRDQLPPQKSQRFPGIFNLPDALKQIESHVSFLRSELNAAQNKLRQREDDARRGKRKVDVIPVVKGELSVEELARVNQQLEIRIVELQRRIDDLAADAEDRAASGGALTDESVDGDTALRALLALKLQDDYEDYRALQEQSRDLVVQQHYRSLLAHIFEVLTQEGVPLRKPQHERG